MISLDRRSWLIWIVGLGFLFMGLCSLSSRRLQITFNPSQTSQFISPPKNKPRYAEEYSVQPLDGEPQHPEDYSAQPLDDERCEAYYGPQYLQHIADHHIPYCEDDSRSTMECFITHKQDPLCIARGVRYQTNPAAEKKKFSMHCQLRNFASEIAGEPATVDQLGQFQNVEDFGEYFFGTGAKKQLEQWDISKQENDVVESCDSKTNDGKYTLLVIRESNKNVWHKLMELWQGMITLDALQMTAYLPASQRGNVQVVFEDDDAGPVDGLWGLVTGNEPIRLSSMSDTCLGDVILPLAGSSSPFWDSHWEDRDCKTKYILDPFLRRIYRHLGITPSPRPTAESKIVTIIDRKGTRRIYNLHGHIAKLSEAWPYVKFQVIDFAEIPLRKQVEVARDTDVLVGAMGAGLTHILFLPDESAIVELMAPGTHYSGFRNLAKMRQIPYFAAEGVEEGEWNATYSATNGTAMNATAMNTTATNATATNAIALNATAEATDQVANVKRHWQEDMYLYFTEESFAALVTDAINAQLNGASEQTM